MVALLKKIPLGVVEMSAIRERAEQLRDGNFCDYRPVLPLMLASFIFDVLCTPGGRRHPLARRFGWQPFARLLNKNGICLRSSSMMKPVSCVFLRSD